MLIKEYRIPMPLRVSEYRIAQLYMIQKKSCKESEGEGSGVEILVNEPYTNEQPNGQLIKGQYTHKIYHVGKHLPSWFRSIIPLTAQRVEEEAWNAYPYTKTRYTCPFMEKFYVEIETKYFDDPGIQDNVFNLPTSELKQRSVEYIDIVKDSLANTEPSENPALFKSKKTGRGPLSQDWLFQSTKAWEHKDPNSSIMCAYKLCRIDFRYWGMQSKVEKFITDIALRKTMVSAHQQAWCWQDEWTGLTIEDIRKLESETQKILALKMRPSDEPSGTSNITTSSHKSNPNFDNDEMGLSQRDSIKFSGKEYRIGPKISENEYLSETNSSSEKLINRGPSLLELLGDETQQDLEEEEYDDYEEAHSKNNNLPDEGEGDNDDTISIFYDAVDESTPKQSICLTKDNLPKTMISSDIVCDKSLQGFTEKVSTIPQSQTTSNNNITPSLPNQTLQFNKILFIVIHGGNFLDTKLDHYEKSMKFNDFQTFKSTLVKNVLESYEKEILRYFGFEIIIIPNTFTRILELLINLRPNGYIKALRTIKSPNGNVSNYSDDEYFDQNLQYSIPLSALPLLAASADLLGPEHYNSHILEPFLIDLLDIYVTHLQDNPQVILVCDMVGSLVTYDTIRFAKEVISSANPGRSLNSQQKQPNLNFQTNNTNRKDVLKAFLNNVRSVVTFGSPLGLILTQRLLKDNSTILYHDDTPSHGQRGLVNVKKSNKLCHLDPFLNGLGDTCSLFNIFYEMDPYAFRIEPLLVPLFRFVPPFDVDYYASTLTSPNQRIPPNFPSSTYIKDNLKNCITQNLGIFETFWSETSRNDVDGDKLMTEKSDFLNTPVDFYDKVCKVWWGTRRIDYVLKKCPPVFKASQYAMSTLPHIFHGSYWESRSIASFIVEHVIADWDLLPTSPPIHANRKYKFLLQSFLKMSNENCNRKSVYNADQKTPKNSGERLIPSSPLNVSCFKRFSDQKSFNKSSIAGSEIEPQHSNLRMTLSSNSTDSKTSTTKPFIPEEIFTKEFYKSSIKPKIWANWNRTKSIFSHSKSITMANHRANDIILNVSTNQEIIARFSYGPFEILKTGNQKVQIYYRVDDILNPIYAYQTHKNESFWTNETETLNQTNNKFQSCRADNWIYLAENQTSLSGKFYYRIPKCNQLKPGIYEIKLILCTNNSNLSLTSDQEVSQDVEYKPESPKLSLNVGIGDRDQETNNSLMMDLAVIDKAMKIVIFSIDGALYDSVSISGKEAKVKKGSIDVTCHWMKAGYLILYLSARPDFQMNNVISWMTSKGFPPSFIHFSDYNYDKWPDNSDQVLYPSGSSFSGTIEDNKESLKDDNKRDLKRSSLKEVGSEGMADPSTNVISSNIKNYPFLTHTLIGMKNKASYLKYLIEKVGCVVEAAYGSTKDIPLYINSNIPTIRIYSLSKVPKKYHGMALEGGYIPHLEFLKRQHPVVEKLKLGDFSSRWKNRGSFK